MERPLAKKKKNNEPKNESSSSRNQLETMPKPSYLPGRLNHFFYNQNCVQLAKRLLGKYLVRNYYDTDSAEYRILRGKIVETESYMGVGDKASHSYRGKRTARTEAMFMNPGTAYVYPIYGMYFCFNISSQGEGAAVLLRAIEPIEGLDLMAKFRSVRRLKGAVLKSTQLCNGPAKICQSFCISKENFNQKDLSVDKDMWLEMGEDIVEEDIVSCKRIGIDRVGAEWANCPLRFYISGNPYISVIHKDKK